MFHRDPAQLSCFSTNRQSPQESIASSWVCTRMGCVWQQNSKQWWAQSLKMPNSRGKDGKVSEFRKPRTSFLQFTLCRYATLHTCATFVDHELLDLVGTPCILFPHGSTTWCLHSKDSMVLNIPFCLTYLTSLTCLLWLLCDCLLSSFWRPPVDRASRSAFVCWICVRLTLIRLISRQH